MSDLGILCPKRPVTIKSLASRIRGLWKKRWEERKSQKGWRTPRTQGLWTQWGWHTYALMEPEAVCPVTAPDVVRELKEDVGTWPPSLTQELSPIGNHLQKEKLVFPKKTNLS